MFGHMDKKGRVNKSWKRRFFRRPMGEPRLYYYPSEHSFLFADNACETKFIELRDAFVSLEKTMKGSTLLLSFREEQPGTVFTITTKEANSTRIRAYCLRTASPRVTAKWLDELSAVCTCKLDEGATEFLRQHQRDGSLARSRS